MFCRTFWLPKQGNTVDEYEDASAVDTRRGCFAITDGATESSFAGTWAQLLTQGFINLPSGAIPPCESWLPPLRQRWLEQVTGRPLPWYAEAKLAQGAFATFLGLMVSRRRGALRRWQAIAVGDSCLFHLRQDRLHHKFPIACSSEFGSTPWMLSSRPPTAAVKPPVESRATGSWRLGDRFWLMTDALAQWFLCQAEAGAYPWHTVQPVLDARDGASAFQHWIETLRGKQQLRNDDVTLVAIQL
jgi:hypothetical protein